MKVLIVEDQGDLAKNIHRFLSLEGFSPESTSTAEEAYELLKINAYDCMILDISLPGMSGIDLCKKLRLEGSTIPILILTARAAKDSVVEGLNIGADDYITKPFDMSELVARIRSVLRRNNGHPNPVITIGKVSIDTSAKEVKRGDTIIKLAPKEYQLLEYLVMNRNKVMERSTIIEHVWGEFDEYMFSQTVDVHISYLRKKLGKELITTAPGGYMIRN